MSDSYGLGLINSSTLTRVDVETQDNLASSADYYANQSRLQIQDMPMPPDNEMQDIAPPVEDHLPEQPVGPSGESQDNARPSEATFGPPAHEGELTYFSMYLVQCVPMKQNKPSSASYVTGARILTSEKCAQIIFEREEKKRNEKEKKKARKVAREQRKKEKEEIVRKNVELTEKRKEEAAKRKKRGS